MGQFVGMLRGLCMENNIYYHYCSVETLISILKFKTIRLSDVNKLNDSHETKEIAVLLQEAVFNSLKKSVLRDNIILGMTKESALRFITKSAINQLVLSNDSLQYIFCLSENGDLLSQWRGYGDSGRGVSIGFNIESIEEIIQSNHDIYFGKVSYVDKNNFSMSTFQDVVDTIVQQIISAINTNTLENIYTNPCGASSFDRWERLDIFQKSILYKNITFQEEQEHRIVYNPKVSKSDFIDELDVEQNAILFPWGVQFKSIDNDIVSFLDLSFESRCDDSIINEIILGPNCNASVDDIEFLFKAYKFYDTAENLNVISSRSTYQMKL